MIPPRSTRAYTLIEVLVVVVILGIAGAMVIPAIGDTGVLKIQGALRTIVSDITFAQSDAVAFQERRAIVFDVEQNRYSLVQVPGTTIDIGTNTMYDPTRPGGRYTVEFNNDPRYGEARFLNVDLGAGSRTLIFDAMGGPIEAPDSNNPGPGGTIRVGGNGTSWTITVEAFTGRVTVAQDVTTPTP